MPKIPLAGVFGLPASQDASNLIIPKAGLLGLTVTADNTAESLLVGVLLFAALKLNPEIRDIDPDRSIAIEQGFATTVVRLGREYTQEMFVVTIQKPKLATSSDPDDY